MPKTLCQLTEKRFAILRVFVVDWPL